jgi:ATP-dependent Lhr-like helicase
MESLNKFEVSKRKFKEIAQISGLIFREYPGEAGRAKSLKMSSELLYKVFEQYNPENPLYKQAQVETIHSELNIKATLKKITKLAETPIRYVKLSKLTPFSFPLFVESLREWISTSKLSEIVKSYRDEN